MNILIPIGLGFIINLVIFIVSKGLKQNNKKSFLICLLAFLVVLLISFIVGSWVGMGIGVISIGMLIFVILLGLVFTIVPRKKAV